MAAAYIVFTQSISIRLENNNWGLDSKISVAAPARCPSWASSVENKDIKSVGGAVAPLKITGLSSPPVGCPFPNREKQNIMAPKKSK